jgi:glycerol kinase
VAAPCLIALDQGTTSTRVIAFSPEGAVLAVAQEDLPQAYPQPGWVEHDPEMIWASVLSTLRRVLAQVAAKGLRPVALGITNQRETVVLWDRHTGRPLHNAIVWQDRRTARTCQDLEAAGHEPMIAARTGLRLDPYFSATKLGWLYDQLPGAREAAAAGRIAAGTIDSFLIWRLTGGRTHATDTSNASRTLLFDIHRLCWDTELCALFGVPLACLPEVREAVADYGHTDPGLLDVSLPIRGVAGDQQAALIGQACLSPGAVKSTYGTGAFLVMNTGAEARTSQHRLLTTVGYTVGGRTTYALEGSILSAGATVQWLRDGLGLITRSAEVEALARQADPDSGVWLVPAFAGLGAPWWQPDARAAILGLTRGAGKAEIARAALDATAYQTAEVLAAMAADGQPAGVLRVDGGMTANDWLMQRLADITGVEVARPAQTETTSWGAAVLAGVGAGVFGGLVEAGAAWAADAQFTPALAADARARGLSRWRAAVAAVAGLGSLA